MPHRGWSGTRARLATTALFAAALPISALGVTYREFGPVERLDEADSNSLRSAGRDSRGRDAYRRAVGSRLLRVPSPPNGGWRILRMPGIFLLAGRPRDVSNEPQDIRVRDTWEIPRSRVKIDRWRWNRTLLPVLEELRADLGLADGCRLKAELHSFLVYGPGQFFLPHQDSEKADAMVGTLVVTLPASFKGGALVVEHQGEKVVDRGSRRQLSFVAARSGLSGSRRPSRRHDGGMMGIATFEAIVENGQIRLPATVRLPEKAKVFVVVPGVDAQPMAYVGSPRHRLDVEGPGELSGAAAGSARPRDIGAT